MLSISNVSLRQASSYYDKDGYYARMGDTDNCWRGELKDELGLAASVDKADFDRLLSERPERAGYDLCFSAPKSVSIAMCLDEATRRDMLEAHNTAVKMTLDLIEKREIGARVTANKKTEHIKTGNMIVGCFNHYVNRSNEPQIHTHSVILNKTKYNGKYYAIDNPPLYKNKILYGQLYRNFLAGELLSKGYQVSVTDREKGFFELSNISKKPMERFSSRRADIEEQLKSWGTQAAQAAERAALLTRKAKEHKDIKVLMASWKETLAEMGITSLAKAPPGPIIVVEEQYKAEFENAVKRMTRKTFAFTKLEFEKVALACGVGVAMTEEKYKELLSQSMGEDVLELGIRKDRRDSEVYYCTKKNYEMEKEIFRETERTKNKMAAIPLIKAEGILDKIAVDQDGNDRLSQQQKDAVLFIATNRDQYSAVQGLAGTGKTHMLNYAREVLEAEGFTVKGACFTGKAADGLQQDAKIPSATIHSFLNRLEREAGNADPGVDYKEKAEWDLAGLKPSTTKEAWIVDEASMVDNTTMRSLMVAADAKGAKVIFVGDRKQLLPVGIGNAFAKMVESKKIKTITLDEIRRQEDAPTLLESVREAVNGDIAKSFALIDKDVQVIAAHKNRMKAIIAEYTKLEKLERDETVILTAGNKDRRILNKGIRAKLKESGELPAGTVFKVEDSRGNTSEREFAVGDKIIFLQNDNKLGVRNGRTGVVREVRNNGLTVVSAGKEISIDLNQYKKLDHGYAMTTYKAQGITANQAIINLDSAQKNMNSRNSYYVDISRARLKVKLFTDDREKIENQVQKFAQKLTSEDFIIRQGHPGSNTVKPKGRNFKDVLNRASDAVKNYLGKTKVEELAKTPDRDLDRSKVKISMMNGGIK